jgi:hypothetical protein
MHPSNSIARQAQIYLATASSSALLLAGLVAAFVVLTLGSTLRSFPIPQLDGVSLPGFAAPDQASPADSSGDRGQGAAARERGGQISGAFGPSVDRNRPGEGRAAAGDPRRSTSRAPDAPRGPVLTATAAPAAAGTVSESSAHGGTGVADDETSSDPSEPPATLPVEPTVPPDPPVDAEPRETVPPAEPVEPGGQEEVDSSGPGSGGSGSGHGNGKGDD